MGPIAHFYYRSCKINNLQLKWQGLIGCKRGLLLKIKSLAGCLLKILKKMLETTLPSYWLGFKRQGKRWRGFPTPPKLGASFLFPPNAAKLLCHDQRVNFPSPSHWRPPFSLLNHHVHFDLTHSPTHPSLLWLPNHTETHIFVCVWLLLFIFGFSPISQVLPFELSHPFSLSEMAPLSFFYVLVPFLLFLTPALSTNSEGTLDPFASFFLSL